MNAKEASLPMSDQVTTTFMRQCEEFPNDFNGHDEDGINLLGL